MPGYLVKHEHIDIDGAQALHIRSLLDRQQFSDPLGEAEALGISSAQWPLFGLLWPSGYRLATAMALRPVLVGERILEIGCGLGLASLVCHRRGADITASDCHPLAGPFLQENARLNGLVNLPYDTHDWGTVTDPTTTSRYDTIIGSDVLYERDDGANLPRFIEHHGLAQCEVLIVDPNRGNRAAFTRRMLAMGYTLLETLLDTPALNDIPAYKGRLLHYTRLAAAL